jgi:hypothetical protein
MIIHVDVIQFSRCRRATARGSSHHLVNRVMRISRIEQREERFVDPFFRNSVGVLGNSEIDLRPLK